MNTSGFADLHYRVNGGAQLNVAMSAVNGRKEYAVNGLNNGDTVSYWFTYLNPQTGLAVDTATMTYMHQATVAIVTYVVQENTAGFCGVNGTIDNNHAGYTGSGFANTANANGNGNGVDYAISAPSSGTYAIQFVYANGSGTRSASLLVNGANAGSFNFSGTGAWTSWTNSATVNVNLQGGNNRLRLQATNNGGLPNMDRLQVTGNNPQPGNCN